MVVTEAVTGKYFLNRTRWLAVHKEEMDLRFVIHTGDVVNWGNENPEQFAIASEAFEALEGLKFRLRYAWAIMIRPQ